jgi:hypothetical protein
MGVPTMRRMHRRNTQGAGWKMRRYGIGCGLPVETIGIVSGNPYCFLNIIHIIWAAVR